MKTMKIKTLITFLMIGFTTILFSQNVTINAKTNWNGRMCNGGHGMCYIESTSNKSTSNTTLTFNKENKELILEISKIKLDDTSKLKLTNNELEKDFYLYTFDNDFELSIEIKNSLGITNLSKIKKGNYLITEKGNYLIIKLKLE